MADESADKLADEALALSEQIKPLLAGKGAAMQSAVLANLLSAWIAGHRPDVRAAALKTHMTLVADLVPASEKEIFGPFGWNAQ